VETHLAQHKLKKYVHEISPQDEIFRGDRSYEEVLNKVQTLSPNIYIKQREARSSRDKFQEAILLVQKYNVS
jgi:hypothetical protein